MIRVRFGRKRKQKAEIEDGLDVARGSSAMDGKVEGKSSNYWHREVNEAMGTANWNVSPVLLSYPIYPIDREASETPPMTLQPRTNFK